MPTFNELVDLSDWVDIEVSVEDFYKEMDTSEKREMAGYLQQDGFDVGSPIVESRATDGQDFQEALRKLATAYYSLSNEDIAPIIQLAKRF